MTTPHWKPGPPLYDVTDKALRSRYVWVQTRSTPNRTAAVSIAWIDGRLSTKGRKQWDDLVAWGRHPYGERPPEPEIVPWIVERESSTDCPLASRWDIEFHAEIERPDVHVPMTERTTT